MANQKPNQYSLSNKQIKVEYSTSGIQGQPSLSYRERGQTSNFNGDQIRVQSTELGDLVSVTLKTTVDVGFSAFSLLIPAIEVSGPGGQEAFETVGIQADHKTPLVQPPTGARTTYKTEKLKGTARIVEFLAAQPGAGAD